MTHKFTLQRLKMSERDAFDLRGLVRRLELPPQEEDENPPRGRSKNQPLTPLWFHSSDATSFTSIMIVIIQNKIIATSF